MSTLLVVANVTDPEAGHVGERFSQRGFSTERVHRDRAGTPLSTPDGISAVLLLGSEWSVAEPVDRTALEAECSLVRSASSSGVPVLGLCYGAQVAAYAFGGRVVRAPAPEIGLVGVRSKDESLVPAGPWWAFHTDVIEPPAKAEVVADNDCGVQAVTLPGVLGVQFHPEVLPDTLGDWFRRFPSEVELAGLDPEALVAEARAREPESRRLAHALVDDFLDRVVPS
jgi:GMP synthase (glutamine-hydrolysing)